MLLLKCNSAALFTNPLIHHISKHPEGILLTCKWLLRFLLPDNAAKGISLIIACETTVIRILHHFLSLFNDILLSPCHLIPLLLELLPQQFVFLAQVLLFFIADSLLLPQIEDQLHHVIDCLIVTFWWWCLEFIRKYSSPVHTTELVVHLC